MRVNWDGQLLEHLPEALATAQRALFYGDALFETMRVSDGKIPLLKRHWERLHHGLTLLGFAIPSEWSHFFWEKNILSVAPLNARIRLTVWRAAGGHYCPTANQTHFLITAEPLAGPAFEWLNAGLTLGTCTSVQLPVDAYSNLKTLNAARYVAAAREAQALGWDEALLLNCFGRACETTTSNLFWWSGDTLHTVPLNEGCVAGVMRAWLLEIAAAAGIQVEERPTTPDALQAADEIFLTNAVRGIQPIRIFAGTPLTTERTRQLFDYFCAQWSAC